MLGRLKRDISGCVSSETPRRVPSRKYCSVTAAYTLSGGIVFPTACGVGLPLTARYISQLARWLTGIEIHPGATIGEGLFIDHGMGVVIGETAELGRNVTLYPGVTLGGTGKEKGKRHPTVGDNVLVGAGAKILGSFTVGDNTLVGSNAVVLRPLPANSTAVGVPAEIVRVNGMRPQQLEHDKLPDPVHECLETMVHASKRWKHASVSLNRVTVRKTALRRVISS